MKKTETIKIQKLSAIKIFYIFLRLGLTSFGGPIAHIAYFRKEFVNRYKWVGNHVFADLVALCQLLPGPSSSQLGMILGFMRGGYRGALASWLGFTLPSAIVLIIAGLIISSAMSGIDATWFHGLKVVAVAIVAQAVWYMGNSLCPDKVRASLAVIAAIIVTIIPSIISQIAVIFSSAILGWLFLNQKVPLPHIKKLVNISRRQGGIILTVFIFLLLMLPLIGQVLNNSGIQVFSSFYQVGSLVFGGGHVVLPLLQSTVVTNGLISNNDFLIGYGIAQAIPGPLFAFAAYLGTVQSGIIMGVICLIAIFLPSFLIVLGVFPFWEQLRNYPVVQKAMLGVNASVVGLLLAALYNPLWTSSISNIYDFSLLMLDFLLLTFWKLPSWAVVIISAILGAISKFNI